MCVCVRTCVCVSVYVSVRATAHICGYQRRTLGVLLYKPSDSFETGSFTDPRFRLVTSKSQPSSRPCPTMVLGLQVHVWPHLPSYVGSEYSNSDPHTCTQALSSESVPHPYYLPLKSELHFKPTGNQNFPKNAA